MAFIDENALHKLKERTIRGRKSKRGALEGSRPWILMATYSVFDLAVIRADFENAGIGTHFIPIIWKYATLSSSFFVIFTLYIFLLCLNFGLLCRWWGQNWLMVVMTWKKVHSSEPRCTSSWSAFLTVCGISPPAFQVPVGDFVGRFRCRLCGPGHHQAPH